jgi:hypothetical protein
MSETPFIVTIDTEGDNLWEKPRAITTRNAAYLPRFQQLCEKFRFKPVYLTNHEMAMSDVFVDFARDVVARGAGEVGMHLHAWNSPPLVTLTGDDFHHQPYLIEYPERVMREKIRAVTGLLEDRLGRKMVSHRAGRWALDACYAGMLLDEGYLVDCSVTPGVDWRGNPGAPGGKGGSDYSAFDPNPHFLRGRSRDAAAAPARMLLEVPMTVMPGRLFRWSPWLYRIPGLRRAAGWISPAHRWLCPVPLLEKRNVEAMLGLARRARHANPTHLQFMLHSCDLMPGGSPHSGNAQDVEHMYACLEVLFEEVSAWCRGMTLAEFREHWLRSPRAAPHVARLAHA